jgi:hypothetical protein
MYDQIIGMGFTDKEKIIKSIKTKENDNIDKILKYLVE